MSNQNSLDHSLSASFGGMSVGFVTTLSSIFYKSAVGLELGLGLTCFASLVAIGISIAGLEEESSNIEEFKPVAFIAAVMASSVFVVMAVNANNNTSDHTPYPCDDAVLESNNSGAVTLKLPAGCTLDLKLN